MLHNAENLRNELQKNIIDVIADKINNANKNGFTEITIKDYNFLKNVNDIILNTFTEWGYTLYSETHNDILKELKINW